MPMVFLHSHLLDFNQPKTKLFFYIKFALGSVVHLITFGFVLLLMMLYYKW